MASDSETGDPASASRGQLLRSPDNWTLFYETAKHMTARQLAGVLERHGRHLIVPRLPLDFDNRYDTLVPGRPSATPDPVRKNTARLRNCVSRSRRQAYRQRLDEVGNGRLTFLRTTLDVETGDGPDWFHPELEEVPALWALKFHGFEFLEWAFLTAETAADRRAEHALFKSWIRNWADTADTGIGTRQYLRRAWTPHSVSLRVLNLARYYAWCVNDETDTAFLRLLRRLVFKNALFLENHVEHDIGGNHLVENAVALVAAGVLFADERTSWLSTGLSVLDDATDQFLGDGGHFERSPMYHSITLQRYLTALSLLDEHDHPRPANLVETARRAAGFLSSIRPPDGRIPLLNDAVYGEALALDSCLAYARAVDESLLDAPDRRAMRDSGYFWLGDGDDRLLVDGGPFGPRHLPAHSHNDFLSILLWVDGKQLLTDTGTFHYAPGTRRQYARSVRSHNTVQVGTTEPVLIGGQYLAGKRPEVDVRYVQSDTSCLFEGTYSRDADPEYRHRRRIDGGDDWWLVEDTVSGATELPVTQRLHCHPAVDLDDHPLAQDGFALTVDGAALAYVLPPDADSIRQRSTPYFPEFCLERTRPTLEFERDTREPMRFLLSKEPQSRADYRDLRSSVAGTDGELTENRAPELPH